MKPDAEGWFKMDGQQAVCYPLSSGVAKVKQVKQGLRVWGHTCNFAMASLIFSTFTSLKPLTFSSVFRVAAWTDLEV